MTEAFELSSPAFAEGDTIPLKYVFNGWGAEGENISPPLQWTGVPEGAQSLALTVYDPDAPTGSGFWHWVIFNIPAGQSAFPEGATGSIAAPSIEGRTDWGAPGYGGPCPPPGAPAHRYIFTLHALSVPALPLDAEASAAMVGFMIGMNSLGSAKLTAHYAR